MKKKENVVDLGQITQEIIRSWSEKYNKDERRYYCKTCGWPINQTTCYVSIHIKEFEPEHAGPGRVVKINYPYCPKCDGKIDYALACYHVEALKREVIEIEDVTFLLNPGQVAEEIS